MVDTSMKKARLSQGVTLKDLSEKTGLSPAFLSEVENGKANPTLDTLRRIAKGLGLSVFDILTEDRPFFQVVRAKERRVITVTEYNVQFEQVSTLTPSARSQAVVAWLYPNACTSDEAQSHGLPSGSEEIALILKGVVQMEIGDEVHVLNEGDSVRFDPFLPHRYVNTGQSRAGVLTIMTPPSF
ncbi:MAG TPA: helix-turn-helix transcriptional regulator [Firmicutes bacterium]|jgi:transcriptional regulator with XRE-family HTH domain|nr:helix-turn-helix transcriptional regulator [Bacillota bacterium]